jgi:hypothetical protein
LELRARTCGVAVFVCECRAIVVLGVRECVCAPGKKSEKRLNVGDIRFKGRCRRFGRADESMSKSVPR